MRKRAKDLQFILTPLGQSGVFIWENYHWCCNVEQIFPQGCEYIQRGLGDITKEKNIYDLH